MNKNDKQLFQGGKVLILGTSDVALGGMERIIFGLTRSLQAQGRDAQAVFPETDRSAALRAWGQSQGVDAEMTPALRCITASHGWGEMLALARFLRRARPKIVNLHYGNNFISLKDVLAVRLAGVPRCYVTIHQAASWKELGTHKQKMTRQAAPFCDAVIAICGATREVLLEAGVPSGRIKTLYCGIPEPVSLPTRAEARCRLGLDQQDFVVASLCNLVPRKGITDLVEAAARVSVSSSIPLRLVIAGDGPERAGLEAQAVRLLGGRALFLGAVAGETADVYAAADVFALPSFQEGLPLVYLEAAFHNVPSIGTCVGGSPEAILDGKTGLLVPPGNPEALAAAIQRLYDDPVLRRRLGEAAHVYVQERFTEQAMRDRYENLFFGKAPPAP